MLRQNGETSRHCCAIKFFKRIVITMTIWRMSAVDVPSKRLATFTAAQLQARSDRDLLSSRFSAFQLQDGTLFVGKDRLCANYHRGAGPGCDIDSDDVDVRHGIPIATAALAAILIPSALVWVCG
jgi:hypothetical protein